jgi:hypothetical protein
VYVLDPLFIACSPLNGYFLGFISVLPNAYNKLSDGAFPSDGGGGNINGDECRLTDYPLALALYLKGGEDDENILSNFEL